MIIKNTCYQKPSSQNSPVHDQNCAHSTPINYIFHSKLFQQILFGGQKKPSLNISDLPGDSIYEVPLSCHFGKPYNRSRPRIVLTVKARTALRTCLRDKVTGITR